eukprot:PITA_10207
MNTNIHIHGRDSACFPFIGQSIKLFYIIVVVAAFIITLHGRICDAQATICNRDFNYTNGSVFGSNLNTVFNSLVQHTSQTGFNTSVFGQSPNQIYGLLNCRGDVTADECHNCSQRAIATIRRSEGCGNGVGGTIWMDVCFLRYENYTFFGQLYSYGLYTFITTNVSEPQVFGEALDNLLSNLSSEAASRSKLYASGITTDSLYRKIYGLVQCWRDISSDDCTTCLSNTINSIFATFPGNPGVQGLRANCIIRYEIYSFFKSTAPPPSPSPPITPVVDPGRNENTPPGKSSKKTPISLGLGVAAGLLLLLLICLFSCRRRLKSAVFRRPSQDNGHVEEEALMNEDRQLVFTMETLLAATGNFHDDNKLGEGGFGAVYKGITPDGKEIAVKKLSLRSLQGKKEFLNEVKLVAKIQHRNLVNLLGCCAEGSERLLVYEYLPNKSLDKILFDPNKRNQLDWQKRYNIITGIARGLLYLHQDSQLRIIHRDIKASNILLDEKLNPKIADFGLAKLFPDDESHVSTRVAGTYGYMAPEYALQGQLSVKADVYSFGVLFMEIMTGRKNRGSNLQSSEMEMLLGWAWRLYRRGDILQIIDPSINERCDEEQACRCIHVAFLCTQADPSLRPQMSTVNLMLSSHSVTLPNPTKPAFVRSHASQSANSTGSGLSHSTAPTSSSVSSHTPVVAAPSNADASITELEPR